MKHLMTLLFVVGITATITAQQFNMNAELRPRYENRHGYKTLLPNDTTDGSHFISQRTRLNFNYKNKSIKMRVSLQNVRVWGDVSTLSASDANNALHEAWASVSLNENLELKLGRQEIVYDDSRIFGNVGWAQQARSHDAFIAKIKANDNNRIDIGFALNADSQALTDNVYSNTAGYKTFQYAWYHGDFNNLGLSLLALNTGIEYLDSNSKQKIDYFQTLGPRLTYKKNKLDANAAFYLQTGKRHDIKVNAMYYTVNLGYKVSDAFKIGLGYEYLSGKDMNDTDMDIKTFSPLFGTNHKFNGWMDYFYVGFGNPTGLQDINATLSYKSGKFSAKLIPHLFSAAADVYNGTDKMDPNLGTEIDFVLGYKLAKEVSFNAGYSKMLATETMEIVKGGDKDANNAWAWVMFTFKPNLFTYTQN